MDWYAAYPDVVQVDPLGPDSGLFRVIRGGSWYYYASRCRVADRSYYASAGADYYGGFGFRVARSSVPQ